MIFLVGFTFWALLIDLFALLALLFLVETHHSIFGAIILFILWPLAMWVFSGFQYVVYVDIWQNPIPFFFGVLAYLVIGIGWSVFKWWTYLNTEEVKKKALVYLASKQKRNPHDNPDPYTKQSLLTDRYSPLSPLEATNYSRLMRWLAWWPISVLSTLFRELVVKLFENIFNWVKGIYVNISRKVVDNLPE